MQAPLNSELLPIGQPRSGVQEDIVIIGSVQSVYGLQSQLW